MPVVGFILALVAGKNDFLGIDDDDVVATVHVGGKGGLVLATQAVGDDRGCPADNQSIGVDQHPLLLDILGFRRIGLHLFFQ